MAARFRRRWAPDQGGTMEHRYDLAIVGSGMGGATLARGLAGTVTGTLRLPAL